MIKPRASSTHPFYPFTPSLLRTITLMTSAQTRVAINDSFLSPISTLFGGGEHSERAMRIEKVAMVRNFHHSIRNKLEEMNLTTTTKDIQDVLDTHEPLRYKDKRTVTSHVVATLIETGRTKSGGCTEKTSRSQQQEKRKRKSSPIDIDEFPSPPPSPPPRTRTTQKHKKPSVRVDSDVDYLKHEMDASNNHKRRRFVTNPSVPTGSSQTGVSKTKTTPSKKTRLLPKQATKAASITISPRDRPQSPANQQPGDVKLAFNLMEKQPDGWVREFFNVLRLPSDESGTMSKLIVKIAQAMRERSKGGQSLTSTERQKLGTSLCEYFVATRRRPSEVQVATMSAQSTLSEVDTNAFLQDKKQLSSVNASKDVEKLLSASDALIKSWRRLHTIVETRRLRGTVLSELDDPEIRREDERSATNMATEMAKMNSVVKEASATIERTKLRIHSIDVLLDRSVSEQEQDAAMPTPSSANLAVEQPQLSTLRVGTVVLSPFKRKSAFYRGHVAAINEDGTLKIQYDDGDIDKSIPANMVHVEGAAPTQASKPRSTSSIINFLDRAKNDSRLNESLKERQKLTSKVRSQQMKIEHAQQIIRILELMAKLSRAWLDLRSRLANDSWKKMKDEMTQISRLIEKSATVLGHAVVTCTVGLFKRKSLIKEDVLAHKESLTRHDRIYGESAPKVREDIVHRLSEVTAVFNECDAGMKTVHEALTRFVQARAMTLKSPAFPPNAAASFFNAFTNVTNHLMEISSVRHMKGTNGDVDAHVMSTIKSARALATMAKACCHKTTSQAKVQTKNERKGSRQALVSGSSDDKSMDVERERTAQDKRSSPPKRVKQGPLIARKNASRSSTEMADEECDSEMEQVDDENREGCVVM